MIIIIIIIIIMIMPIIFSAITVVNLGSYLKIVFNIFCSLKQRIYFYFLTK